MNRQEIFDKAVAGLRSQKFEKSMIGASCAYRGINGQRCAIGWLIDNADYNEDLEGLSINDPRVQKMANVHPQNQRDEAFLGKLQLTHDTNSQPLNMKRNLEGLALMYDLDPKEIYA